MEMLLAKKVVAAYVYERLRQICHTAICSLYG